MIIKEIFNEVIKKWREQKGDFIQLLNLFEKFLLECSSHQIEPKEPSTIKGRSYVTYSGVNGEVQFENNKFQIEVSDLDDYNDYRLDIKINKNSITFTIFDVFYPVYDESISFVLVKSGDYTLQPVSVDIEDNKQVLKELKEIFWRKNKE